MATSGTYDFTVTNGEAVLAAFERVRVFAPQLRQTHMVTARREMNLLLVEWANKQVNLWKVELLSVPMLAGIATYPVPARVVMILDAWIRLTSGGSMVDRFITPVSRTQYASYANKATPGQPTTYWFDRLIAPTITMWPVQNVSGVATLFYYAVSQMQDSNLQGGQTPDLPYLWLDAFVAGLAHRLSRTYAPDLEIKRKADAVEAWDIAATQNVEQVNLVIAPPIGNYYRR
jgi:hypothetical protein